MMISDGCIGDLISTWTQHSDATAVVDLYPHVSWQWEHKTGATAARILGIISFILYFFIISEVTMPIYANHIMNELAVLG